MKDFVLEQGVVLQEQGERVEHVDFPHAGIISVVARMLQNAGLIRYRRGLEARACECYAVIRRQIDRVTPASRG